MYVVFDVIQKPLELESLFKIHFILSVDGNSWTEDIVQVM